MQWEGFQTEIFLFDDGVGLFADIVDDGGGQSAFTIGSLRLDTFHKTRRIVGQGDTVTSQFLRQRFDQQMDFLFQHPGHQPFTAGCRDLVQCVDRDGEGDAVAGIAWLKMIGQ